MKKVVLAISIVALTTLSGLAQSSPHTHLAPAECDGERYRVVVAGAVLESSANLKKWEKLKKANYPLGNRGDMLGGKYSAMLYEGDELCVPSGMNLGEFLDIGSYGPAVIRVLPGIDPADTVWGRISFAAKQNSTILFVGLVFALAAGVIMIRNRVKNTEQSSSDVNAPKFTLDEEKDFSPDPFDFGKPAPPK